MKAKDAATQLGITQRMLRHYENEGLLDVARDINGYRNYAPADLRRAARIRDFIAVGFSTREVQSMKACLDDAAKGPCEDGRQKMMEKMAQIDRLRSELDARRITLLERIVAMDFERANSNLAG